MLFYVFVVFYGFYFVRLVLAVNAVMDVGVFVGLFYAIRL